MLIINADDYGRNSVATDNTLIAFRRGTVTSASAMVFMDDSERGAQLALEAELEVGLHLNFSESFRTPVQQGLKEAQAGLSTFLRKTSYRKIIYNPFLSKHFAYAFRAQYAEFIRIYGKEPSHIDGHHHFHLCANIVLGNVIPAGMSVRRNYTFVSGDKGVLNRSFRMLMDAWLRRSHVCTDYFFAIPDKEQLDRLTTIFALADKSSVELMLHPEKAEDFNLLRSANFRQMLSGVNLGTHADIKDL